jgi:3-isopropylmalate dehydrogenase
MKKLKVALVEGDGAAPEMMKVACDIMAEAAKLDDIKVIFEETPMGWCALEEFGDTLPQSSFKRAIEIDTIFFGGVGDPKFDDTIGIERPDMRPEAHCLLPIRKEMGLLLNFRPMFFFKELDFLANVKPETIPEQGVEQHWIRFLLEDSYFGNEDFINIIPEELRKTLGVKLKADVTGDEEQVMDLAYYRAATIKKYLRAAFTYARELNLPVISMDKANVMARYLFWRKITTRIGEEEFPDVPLVHQLIDSGNTMIFKPARLRGVIIGGNEHLDILSDGAAEALGSMGLMCSSAINPITGASMFESGAGTAPNHAGQEKANPIGRTLTGAMLLRHRRAVRGAKAIEFAVRLTLKDGYRTGDLFSAERDDPAKLVGTIGMGEKILKRLK